MNTENDNIDIELEREFYNLTLNLENAMKYFNKTSVKCMEAIFELENKIKLLSDEVKKLKGR